MRAPKILSWMADLGWRADGIERAKACGGVELEAYRRPGFTGGLAVRRSQMEAGGSGVAIDTPSDYDPDPDEDRGPSRQGVQRP